MVNSIKMESVKNHKGFNLTFATLFLGLFCMAQLLEMSCFCSGNVATHVCFVDLCDLEWCLSFFLTCFFCPFVADHSRCLCIFSFMQNHCQILKNFADFGAPFTSLLNSHHLHLQCQCFLCNTPNTPIKVPKPPNNVKLFNMTTTDSKITLKQHLTNCLKHVSTPLSSMTSATSVVNESGNFVAVKGVQHGDRQTANESINDSLLKKPSRCKKKRRF